MKKVQLFAAGGEKTAAISQLHLSLLTIPPAKKLSGQKFTGQISIPNAIQQVQFMHREMFNFENFLRYNLN